MKDGSFVNKDLQKLLDKYWTGATDKAPPAATGGDLKTELTTVPAVRSRGIALSLVRVSFCCFFLFVCSLTTLLCAVFYSPCVFVCVCVCVCCLCQWAEKWRQEVSMAGKWDETAQAKSRIGEAYFRFFLREKCKASVRTSSPFDLSLALLRQSLTLVCVCVCVCVDLYSRPVPRVRVSRT